MTGLNRKFPRFYSIKYFNEVLGFMLLLFHVVVVGQSLGYNNNRIAISADGNSAPDYEHLWPRGDPDDWGATPATLALVAKLKAQDRIVHYSYNNFVEAPSGPDNENQMKIGVEGGIQRFNFDPSVFYDATTHFDEAQFSLQAELSKSTADDPLYFIHMGPAEFFYLAVKAVVDGGNADALSHVYIVSHSGYNDDHLRRPNHHTIDEARAYSGNRLNYHKIKDQNGQWSPDVLWNSGTNFSVWHWMRDHQDAAIQWVYERMLAHDGGKADISDMGMVYWLLLGDEDGSPQKLKAFLGDGIDVVSDFVVISPIGDAYLQGVDGDNFNTQDLRVEVGNRMSYILFDLVSIEKNIQSARLELTVGSDGGNGSISIYQVATNWHEETINGLNKPVKLNDLPLVTIDQDYVQGNTYEFDLSTAHFSSGKVAFMVEMKSGNDVSFASKENSGDAGPRLILKESLVTDVMIDEQIELAVYPNPAKEYVRISGYQKGMNWQLIDQKGTVLNQGREAVIDVANLNSGIYVVIFSNGRVLQFVKK